MKYLNKVIGKRIADICGDHEGEDRDFVKIIFDDQTKLEIYIHRLYGGGDIGLRLVVSDEIDNA